MEAKGRVKFFSPKMKVLTRVKKKGSQERQLKAEVVVSIIIVITKSIKNTFDFMVVESSHRNCLDICLLDNALPGIRTRKVKFLNLNVKQYRVQKVLQCWL